MPLVVLFKSESDGPDKFVKALEEENFETRSISCINFHFKNLDSLRSKLENHQLYCGLLFTSQRSVTAVQKATEENKNSLKNWSDKMNYCVGESTSDLAESLLGLETRGNQSGNAVNLSKLIVEDQREKCSSKPFLFPAGNLKQDTIEKSLNDHSIRVESLDVYETVQHEKLDESTEKLKLLKQDYFAYFSPSGVKFSLPLLRKHGIDLQEIKIIAIGPSTRKALEESGLQCFRMCATPSPESLLEALSS